MRIGGLFGSHIGSHKEVLAWSRAQQAAFLIFAGNCVRTAIQKSTTKWAKALRAEPNQARIFEGNFDPAFYGTHSLLATDQGVRALLAILNDICYLKAVDLSLQDWISDREGTASDEKAVNAAIKSLGSQPVRDFLENLASALSKYDWRTSSAPDLTEQERTRKASFRGGGGYKELRQDVLRQLSSESGVIGASAVETASALGYVI